MCERIAECLAIPKDKRILDFGCAKGYLVKGFQELGYQCDGTDISEYALSKAYPDVKDSLFLYTQDNIFGKCYDTVIAKDVFEHIEPEELSKILLTLSTVTNRIFCAVPLGEDGKYIIPEYESDVTHIIRQPKDWWINHFEKCGWKTQFFSYLLDGVKDNWAHYPEGNGFFILSC
jgi:SAM-dependent methyltransferase